MRKIRAFCTVLFLSAAGATCASPEGDPENWRSCRDVGTALSTRVDECLREVNSQISIIDEPGDFYTLWNDFQVCEAFGEGPGMKIQTEMLTNLRVCGGWLTELSCADVGAKLRQIVIDKAKDVGQPAECNPVIQRLQAKFDK